MVIAEIWKRHFLDFGPKESSQTQESCFLLSAYSAYKASSSVSETFWNGKPQKSSTLEKPT